MPTGPTTRRGGNPNLYLANIAVRFAQFNARFFAATQVFPAVTTENKQGKFRRYPREYWLTDEVGPKPRGGYPRQVGYELEDGDYSIEPEWLEATIEDEDEANQDDTINIKRDKTELLMQKHLIHMDVKWTSAFFKTGVWGADRTGVPATPGANQFLQWDNDNSNPLDLIDEYRSDIGDVVGDMFAPNVLVLGRKVARVAKNHPLIIGRLSDTNDRVLTPEKLAAFFEVDKVIVPGGIINRGPIRETIAATKLAADFQRIVGPNDALLVHAAPQPSRERPSGGLTFAWRRLAGAAAANPLAGVMEGRDERGHFTWLHCRVANQQNLVAPELGVFMSGVVAA